MIHGFETKNSKYMLKHDKDGKVTHIRGGKHLNGWTPVTGTPVIIIGAPARIPLENDDVMITSRVTKYLSIL